MIQQLSPASLVAYIDVSEGVQRRTVLVVNSFVFLKSLCFALLLIYSDPVDVVEAIFHTP